MKLLLITIIITSILSSCNWDERTEVNHLTKEFNLAWWSQPKYQSLYLNSESDKYGGVSVIRETVFEIGFDDNFIIAKRYPNLEEIISNRLFGNHENGGDFILDNPNDTVYLSMPDEVYYKNGKWYHISNGWNPPDSFFHLPKAHIIISST